jgi:hypothetical protein
LNASGGIESITVSGSIVTVNSIAHGLSDNERVVIAGTLYYDGIWPVGATVGHPNSFTLVGAHGVGDPTPKGTWTKTNNGVFKISNYAPDSVTLNPPNPAQDPSFQAFQPTGVNWRVNACGTMGAIGGTPINTLTDSNVASINNSDDDTLWVHSGPNTGVHQHVQKISNTVQLASGDTFHVAQTTAVSWKATKGPLVDNTDAFQAAIDAAAAAGGGVVYVPSGYFYFDSSKTIVVRPNVILRGMWTSPPVWRNDYWQAGVEQGPVLLPTGNVGLPDGNPIITLAGDSGSCMIEGLTIYYPVQHLSGAPLGSLALTVQQYPYCIDVQTTCQASGCDNAVKNMLLVNPYQGIRIESKAVGTTAMSGRNFIYNISGVPLKTGILINGLSDVCYIEKIHFNPDMLALYDYTLNTQGQPSLSDWRTFYVQNLTAIRIKAVNWIVIHDVYAFLAHCGVEILTDSQATDTEFLATEMQFDQADTGIHVNLADSTSFINAQLTNVSITTYQIGPGVVNSPAAYQTKKCVYGEGSSGASGTFMINTGSLTNFSTDPAKENRVIDWSIPSSGLQLIVTGIWFETRGGSDGLYALNGKTVVHGCVFSGSGTFLNCFKLMGGNQLIYGNDYGANNPGTSSATVDRFNTLNNISVNGVVPIAQVGLPTRVSGLDDLTTGGLFTGALTRSYSVKISSTQIDSIASITQSSTGGPVLITTLNPHLLNPSDRITIVSTPSGYLNGTWQVTILSGTEFTIPALWSGSETGGQCIRDSFEWMAGGGQWSNEVPINGSQQGLDYGVIIQFAATGGHTVNDQWNFVATVNDPLQVFDNAANSLMIVKENGKVGIGRTDPAQFVDIQGSWNSDGGDGVRVKNTDPTDSSRPAQIFFDRSAIGGTNQHIAAVGMDHTNRNFFLWVNGSDRLNIDPNGRVGIGTTSPNSATQLDVNGIVNATGYMLNGTSGGSGYLNLPHPDNPLYYRQLHFENGLYIGYKDNPR